MSLRPEPIGGIPDETTRRARAAFPKGTIVTRLRDEFNVLYDDKGFAGFIPPGASPLFRPGDWPWSRYSSFSSSSATDRLPTPCAARSTGSIPWE